jgi:hypothetical protein
MDQGNQPTSQLNVQPHSSPDHAQSSTAAVGDTSPDRLPLLQQAYLLEQLAAAGEGSKPAAALNKKITAAARRELHLSAGVANTVRRDLAAKGYVKESKPGGKVAYCLTDPGRAYLAGLERPVVSGTTRRPGAIDEAAISDEVREAQKAFLLLQLLDAEGQTLARGEANKFKNAPHVSLGLKAGIANYRRAKLADQGYIRVTPARQTETYTLLPDGLDYLARNTTHLGHATFKLKGKTLNALAAAATESSFERGRPADPTELAEAVLAAFHELRRERHSRSGLVPIHEVRKIIADRFGPGTARHDVMDEVILELWRQQRLGLEAISDLAEASEQQLNDSIQGVHGTLFYLEAPREQPVASQSV